MRTRNALAIGAAIGGAFVIAVGMIAGCDDKWELVAHCATTQAQHVNEQLCCYDARTSAPLGCRPWQDGDNAETACDYCEGE